jgi:hypothetical protein
MRRLPRAAAAGTNVAIIRNMKPEEDTVIRSN